MERQRSRKKKSKLKIIISWFFVLLFVGIIVFAAKVYFDVNNSANTIYHSAKGVNNKRSNKKVELSKKEPFSILLMGTDTGELGRTYKGRTDTMIYVTVNPKTNKTNMVSLARDSRVNISGKNTMAKINAAYAYGGIPMAINTVQDFLNVPVDYYALINMKGVEQMVDSVGGVTVKNKLDFSYDGTHFSIGNVNLDGKDALKYSRMRHDDPQGDFGRQLRQQQIIKAVLKKATSISMVTHYNDFLNALDDNVQTNIKMDQALSMRNNYGKALGNIKTSQLKGHGEMIDGQSFQVMNSSEVNNIQEMLKTQLDIK